MTSPDPDDQPPNAPSPAEADESAVPDGYVGPDRLPAPAGYVGPDKRLAPDGCAARDMRGAPDEAIAAAARGVPDGAAVPAHSPPIPLVAPTPPPAGSPPRAASALLADGLPPTPPPMSFDPSKPAAPPSESFVVPLPWRAGPSAKPFFSWRNRTICLLGGVVVPFICLWIGFPDQPAWQSGSASDIARILLTPQCGWPLWPFLAYNMVSLTLVLYRPERFARRFLVRWGVYSGALTAAVYWVLFGVALAGDLLVVAGWLVMTLLVAPGAWGITYAGLAALGALAGYLWRSDTLVKSTLIAVAVVLAVGVELVGVGFGLGESLSVAFLSASVGITVFAALFFSAPLALLSYAIVSVELLRREAARQGPLRYSLAQLVAVLTWLAAWLGAWRTAYLWALEVYSRLPVEPPQDCYISAAAARGHRRVVRWAMVAGRDGRLRRVNDQMRVLKATELALRAGWPRAHRVCRRLYDRLGPPLARRLRYAWMADLVYLALKPAEWPARIGLAMLAPGSGKWIERLYGRDDRPAAEPFTREP